MVSTITIENLVQIVIAFIGSGVIASLISASASSSINIRNAKLEHITKERSEWRKEMREISVELDNVLQDRRGELHRILTKLKVRINAHGSDGGGGLKKIDTDSLIWKRIGLIEEIYRGPLGGEHVSVIDWDRLEEQIEKLIVDISYLLKDDWERSKTEVNGLLYRIKSCRKMKKYKNHSKERIDSESGLIEQALHDIRTEQS